MKIEDFITLSPEEKAKLEILDLSGNKFYNLNDSTHKDLCTEISLCENLRELNLNNTSFATDKDRLEFLSTSISYCKNLETLIIDDNPFDNWDEGCVFFFFDVISKLQSLIKLSSRKNHFGLLSPSVFSDACNGIGKLKQLQHLDFSDNLLSELNETNLLIFCTVIPQFEDLKTLIINNNHIGYEREREQEAINYFEMLFTAISLCQKLQKLHIKDNALGLWNKYLILIFVTHISKLHLQELDISCNLLNQLNEDEFLIVYSLIYDLKMLRKLDISSNSLGAQPTLFIQLCNLFASRQNLEHIIVNHNKFPALGMETDVFQAFCIGLLTAPRLTQCDYSSEEFSLEQRVQLEFILQRNKILLSLSGNIENIKGIREIPSLYLLTLKAILDAPKDGLRIPPNKLTIGPRTDIAICQAALGQLEDPLTFQFNTYVGNTKLEIEELPEELKEYKEAIKVCREVIKDKVN